MDSQNYYDITIVGGGPVGLFTAFYAGMRQLNIQLIEAMPELGGQPLAHYPEKIITDIPGFFEIKGKNLISNLKEQLDAFNPDIFLNEKVLRIEKEDGLFKITTDKQINYSKVVILAAGSGVFTPRQLDEKTVDDSARKSIHYSISAPEHFRNQDIIVAGGGDSAIDWALSLENVANKVYLVHRRDQFRALEHRVTQLHESSVEVITPTAISYVDTIEHQLHISLQNSKTKEAFYLTGDALLVNYGVSAQAHHFLTDDEICRDKKGLYQTNASQETSIPGLYAVGDSATYDGKNRLIVTGFGEAPVAINHAIQTHLEGNHPFKHSTSLHRSH